MTRYAAFLRAINVGGRRVQMDRLRELFEELGFADVDTYRASGNVVFAADGPPSELEETIEEHLAARLGYEVPTFVRTLSDLASLAEASAFQDVGGAPRKQYVVFLARELDEKQHRRLDDLENEVDQFVADERHIFWHRAVDAGESMPTSDIESALGVVGTRRTLTTVQRIVTTYG